MKKGIMIQLVSLLLVMAFVPGSVLGEEVEEPAAVTQERPSEVKSSVDPAADDAARDDTAVSCQIKTGERSVLPWQPSFLVDGESQPMLASGIYVGSCSQTCRPCLLSNGQCPDFLGRPQKCMSQCP